MLLAVGLAAGAAAGGERPCESLRRPRTVRGGKSRFRLPGVCFSWLPRSKPWGDRRPSHHGGRPGPGSEPVRVPSLGSPQRKTVLEGIWQGNLFLPCFTPETRPLVPSELYAGSASQAFTWELVGNPAGANCST